MGYHSRLGLMKDMHRGSVTDDAANHLLRQWRLRGNVPEGNPAAGWD